MMKTQTYVLMGAMSLEAIVTLKILLRSNLPVIKFLEEGESPLLF